MTSIYAKIKALERKVNHKKHHKNINSGAYNALKAIQAEKGVINPSQKKICDEYACDVFGSKLYSPWLYVYSQFSGGFQEGWIPSNYYIKVVEPNLKKGYASLSRLRSLTGILFKSKFSPDIAYYVNGLWFTPDNLLIDPNMLKDLALDHSEIVVYKSDSSARGMGVKVLESKSVEAHELQQLGNGVLQRYVRQHAFFDQFNHSALTTLRIITTVNDLGEPSVRACNLRFARQSQTHVQSQDQIKVSVDLEDGKMARVGYHSNWKSMLEHPDSGVRFEDCLVPGFQSCMQAALQLQETFRHVRCIGWDIAVDEFEKVRVLEWNSLNIDIGFPESMQGPCFSDLGWEKIWRC